MNKLGRRGKRFLFEISPHEKDILDGAIRRYPLTSVNYSRARNPSPGKPPPESSEQLLEEALAEQKSQIKKSVEAFWNDPGHVRQSNSGYQLALSAEQIELLLQVLNEIRVGCWTRLGSPEDLARYVIPVEEGCLEDYLGMELCGLFENLLLESLGD